MGYENGYTLKRNHSEMEMEFSSNLTSWGGGGGGGGTLKGKSFFQRQAPIFLEVFKYWYQEGNSLYAKVVSLYKNNSEIFQVNSVTLPVQILTLLLLDMTCPVLATSVDPDQLDSEEANWSGSALFVIKYVNIYQKPGSSNLIGWKLEVGVASYGNLFSKARVKSLFKNVEVQACLNLFC